MPVGDDFEIRQRILTGVLRMHPAIEHEAVPAELQIIRVRTDFSLACEINELQEGERSKR